MGKVNGNGLIRLILASVGTAILIAGIILAAGGLQNDVCANKEDLKELKPKVDQNREQIIEWRTKLDGFIAEQRAYNNEQKRVNQQILEKLDER